MERGELSYWKVREITRVACAGTEDYLLTIALHGTADHVEKMVRGFRRAKDAEEMSREAIQHAERSVTWQYDADGSLLVKAKLSAEVGALLLKALDVAMKQIPVEQVQESRRDAYQNAKQLHPAGPHMPVPPCTASVEHECACRTATGSTASAITRESAIN